MIVFFVMFLFFFKQERKTREESNLMSKKIATKKFTTNRFRFWTSFFNGHIIIIKSMRKYSSMMSDS